MFLPQGGSFSGPALRRSARRRAFLLKEIHNKGHGGTQRGNAATKVV